VLPSFHIGLCEGDAQDHKKIVILGKTAILKWLKVAEDALVWRKMLPLSLVQPGGPGGIT